MDAGRRRNYGLALRCATARGPRSKCPSRKSLRRADLSRGGGWRCSRSRLPISAICKAFAGERLFAAGRGVRGRRKRSRATSMRCSVSGRGIKTSGVTFKLEAPEFLLAGEMLCWARRRRGERRMRWKKKKRSAIGAGDLFFRDTRRSQVRSRPRDVEQQEVPRRA